jgi:hypothetical protein
MGPELRKRELLYHGSTVFAMCLGVAVNGWYVRHSFFCAYFIDLSDLLESIGVQYI